MLIELLRETAAADPGRPVVIDAERRSAVDYGRCLARAEDLARGLYARSVSRFAAVIGDVAELLALLGAASATGAEACVYRECADAAEIEARAVDLGHTMVVSDRPLEPRTSLEVLSVDELGGVEGPGPESAGPAPVLIMTTGTTARPKGVRHDWSRLIAPALARRDLGRPERWLLAYSLSQFGGLQVVVHTLASHGTLVVPRSRGAYDALAAMGACGVTHASATPTFWRMIVGALDERSARDLHLEQITLGGEAVPAALLARLAELFPSAHISQVYGSSEIGTAVSVSDGLSGLPLSVLERGEDADVQLRIVDGELHARSRVGMLGYHGDDTAGEGWRPTGDLVEIRDGRIHFVGRTTDTINVGGVKVHPLTVEEPVSRIDGVKLVRAYGRRSPVTGQIVALEVVPEDGVDTVGLEEAIRMACRALPRAAQPRLVKFVSELPMSGNKIVRHHATGP